MAINKKLIKAVVVAPKQLGKQMNKIIMGTGKIEMEAAKRGASGFKKALGTQLTPMQKKHMKSYMDYMADQKKKGFTQE